MKFIKFEEATGHFDVPGVGPVPFVIDKSFAVTCVELTRQDLDEIKKHGNRIYIISAVAPSGDRPLYSMIMTRPPFANPQSNGQAHKN
jgi:hemolysin-activating ACP:hemolysin acyltransferase